MSNFAEEALSIIASRQEAVVKEQMFEINAMLSNSNPTEDFISKLSTKIIEFTILQSSLNNTINLLNQSKIANLSFTQNELNRMHELRDSLTKKSNKQMQIDFPE